MGTLPSVGILLFDDVEVVDFAGPYEVFANHPTPRFELFTLAKEKKTVRARGGLRIQPDHSIHEHPPIDILVVPGGPDIDSLQPEMQDRELLGWIVRQSGREQLTTSVCTGAFILAASGLLNGRKATTHWMALGDLRDYHEIDVTQDVCFQDDGNLITAAGVTSGIEMALHIVERYYGADVAECTAQRMQYERRRTCSSDGGPSPECMR